MDYYRTKYDDIAEGRANELMQLRDISYKKAFNMAWAEINARLAHKEGTFYGEANA